jgi:enterochelin esterase-like enzyme
MRAIQPRWCLLAVTMFLPWSPAARAQVQTLTPPVVSGARPVTVEHIKVHGVSLEGNLEKDAVDRDVIVFLPPSYSRDTRRRFPVVYALHGYSIGAEQWTHEIHVPQTIEGAFAQGAKEMIVVLPDSKTVYGGSIYSSSVTTGDFEGFIAHDVVAYIDAHYRTLATRNGRGLVGHSMGGYGAVRIGMKHPDVFGSVYIMSPGLLAPHPAELPRMGGGNLTPEQAQRDFEVSVAAIHSPQDAASLPLGARAQLAVAAAWSPNPKNPPLYLDLPVREGVVEPIILAKWAANAPLAFIDQYVGNLHKYRAIGLDVGDEDPGREDARQLEAAFARYGLGVQFEVYHGTHTSAVADRFQNHVLPFFSANLCHAMPCP